jgi:hypothetical protein
MGESVLLASAQMAERIKNIIYRARNSNMLERHNWFAAGSRASTAITADVQHSGTLKHPRQRNAI